MVRRLVWDQDGAGSIPVTPTKIDKFDRSLSILFLILKNPILHEVIMETEKTYALNGELDNISFIDLSENELEISRHHVEITRHLQEIHHLFLTT